MITLAGCPGWGFWGGNPPAKKRLEKGDDNHTKSSVSKFFFYIHVLKSTGFTGLTGSVTSCYYFLFFYIMQLKIIGYFLSVPLNPF